MSIEYSLREEETHVFRSSSTNNIFLQQILKSHKADVAFTFMHHENILTAGGVIRITSGRNLQRMIATISAR